MGKLYKNSVQFQLIQDKNPSWRKGVSSQAHSALITPLQISSCYCDKLLQCSQFNPKEIYSLTVWVSRSSKFQVLSRAMLLGAPRARKLVGFSPSHSGVLGSSCSPLAGSYFTPVSASIPDDLLLRVTSWSLLSSALFSPAQLLLALGPPRQSRRISSHIVTLELHLKDLYPNKDFLAVFRV